MAMTDPPMLVLMDDDLPLVNGVATTRRLKAANPQTTVVMLGAHEPARYRIASQMAGADAYVCKRTMHGELVPLLHRLLHDGVAGNDSPASGRPPLPEAR